ncbi:MAG: hypothetical protein NTU83_12275 [Candidatus Hydrogenedentes bacterium]|nr:hypothetical protein [Candidatus Hydrogenedentota bacterium]
MRAGRYRREGGIAAMQPVAEKAARTLANGGKLFAAGQPSLVSEISGRAGGLMMIRPLKEERPAPGDVVLYASEAGAAIPEPLRDTQALVIVFGSKGERPEWPFFSNHAAETGVSPPLANAIPAWLFSGELVAAFTRLGKMPVIYESIGTYGGIPRMAQYRSGEIAFHDDRQVPPMAAGVIANRFADAVKAMLERVEREERVQLDTTGAWKRKPGARNSSCTAWAICFPTRSARRILARYSGRPSGARDFARLRNPTTRIIPAT